MDKPAEISLPFFAYGIFQPGQLGYHRLRELVQNAHPACRIKGSLRIRDGLPLIDPDGAGEVAGTILAFKPEATAEAYQRIGDIEPDKHYRWDQRDAEGIQVNVLVGRSPKKGSVEAEQEWDGRSDPLFTSALDVIEETLDSSSHFEWDLKPLFRLQMAYLLLWSSIERYVSLRYHLGDKVTEKVNALADEVAFADALQEHIQTARTVFRADRPGDKVILDPRSRENRWNTITKFGQISRTAARRLSEITNCSESRFPNCSKSSGAFSRRLFPRHSAPNPALQ